VDRDRFLKDYDTGTARAQVLKEYEEALITYHVNSIPTVIFDGGQKVIGATSLDEYLKILAALGVS
jgi:predicted DsbA family dithiol-disulfide isomerase